MIGESIGRYKIIEELGEGGMATVYKAVDTRLDALVAVKFIRREEIRRKTAAQVLRRFEREAKALAQLNHPYIVKVLDYGEHEGSPYLVMPYMERGTLKEHLGRPIPPGEAARLLLPVARALGYAHERGLVHRDIKPANILVTESGEPMLSDFGIAKLLEGPENTALTGTGMSIGTPEYMAPEQGMGQEVDSRADIYSLGVVLYEMVTGKRPFEADTPMGVVVKHITEPLPAPSLVVPEIGEVVEQVLYKALAKKPEERFANMTAFADVLEILISQGRAHMRVREERTITARAAPSNAATMPVDLATLHAKPTPVTEAGLPAEPFAVSRAWERSRKIVGDRKSPFANLRWEAVVLGLVAVFILALFGLNAWTPVEQVEETATNTAAAQAVGLGTPSPMPSQTQPDEDAASPTATTSITETPKAEITFTATAIVSLDPTAAPTTAPTVTAVSLYEVITAENADSIQLINEIKPGALINSIGISPDGEVIAAGIDNTVHLFRLSNGELVRTFEGNWGNLRSIIFSPDGTTLVGSVGTSNDILVWSFPDGQFVQKLSGHTDGILRLAFSLDGKILASASLDRTVRFWQLEDGSLMKQYSLHGPDMIVGLEFSSSLERLAVSWGVLERELQLLNAEDGSLIWKIQGFAPPVLAFSSNEQYLAEGYTYSLAQIRQVSDGKVVETLIGHTDYVVETIFSRDNSFLLTVSHDNSIRLWRVSDGTAIGSIDDKNTGSFQLSSDGKVIVGISFDGMIENYQPANPSSFSIKVFGIPSSAP